MDGHVTGGRSRKFRARAFGKNHAPARQAPEAAAKALAAIGIRPSKSKGQNFLVQPAIAERIVDALNLEHGDEVIEIGPGLGILSDRIARHPVRRLYLVELDERLAAALRARFAGDPRIAVVAGDFLDIGLTALAERTPVKMVGNLPFSTASAILRKLCDAQPLIARMVLMFQREVAERLRARPGDHAYSALSVFTALYWQIADHFRVGAGNFHPRPKVDAEVVVLRPQSRLACLPEEEDAVLKVIRASFAAPRKTIHNALRIGLRMEATRIAGALDRAAIATGARAETLAVDDFVRLARAINRARADVAADRTGSEPRDA